VPLSWNLGTLTSWNPLGHFRPVTGLLYLLPMLFTVPQEMFDKTVSPPPPPGPGPHGATALSVPGHPHCRRFTITQRQTPLGKTPLYEGSARRRGLNLTTQNTHKRQTFPLGGMQTHNPRKRAAADPRLRPRSHWDWQTESLAGQNSVPAVNKTHYFVMGPKTWISDTVSMYARINKTATVGITQLWGANLQSLLQWKSIEYYIYWGCVF